MVTITEEICNGKLHFLCSVDGIKEGPKETWEACEKKIENIIAYRSGKEDDVEIDRCHRIEPHKTKTSQNRDRPRTAVCKLNRFKNKQRILNNATEMILILIVKILNQSMWNFCMKKEEHFIQCCL